MNRKCTEIFIRDERSSFLIYEGLQNYFYSVVLPLNNCNIINFFVRGYMISCQKNFLFFGYLVIIESNLFVNKKV